MNPSEMSRRGPLALSNAPDPLSRVDKLHEDYAAFEDQMRDVFQAMMAFDEDKNGTLHLSELTTFLTNCGLMDHVEYYERENHLEELFESADGDGNGELGFIEFTLCYNRIMEHRNKHNLPPVDVGEKVMQYLEKHYASAKKITTDAERCALISQKNKKLSHQKAKPKEQAIALLCDQATVTMLVEVFDQTEGHETGRVPRQGFLAKLTEVGFFRNQSQLGHRTEVMHTLLENCDTVVEDEIGLVEVATLILDIQKPTRISQLVKNSRKFLKQQQDVNKLKTKCQLYMDIKNNRTAVTEEIKQEAFGLFAAFDEDLDMQLDFEEFKNAVDCICDLDMAKEIFEIVDIDCSGKISTWEFVALWTMGIEAAVEHAELEMHLRGLTDGSLEDNKLDILLREQSGEAELQKLR